MKRIYPNDWTEGATRAHDAAIRLSIVIRENLNMVTLIHFEIGADELEIRFRCQPTLNANTMALLETEVNTRLSTGLMKITSISFEAGVWTIGAHTGARAAQIIKTVSVIAEELRLLFGINIVGIIKHVKDIVAERDDLLVERDALKNQLVALLEASP